MKKMLISAIVVFVLGLGAGVLGFAAFYQAGVDERYASDMRGLANRRMADPDVPGLAGPTPRDQAREYYADADEAGADADRYRTLGWVSIGGGALLVGAGAVLFTVALRRRAAAQRTHGRSDPNATEVMRHV